MLSCYRKDETHDPQVYTSAVAAVLGDGYSREVVDYVTDPRTGLPSTQKFLPSVAEVREACENRARYLDRLASYGERRQAVRYEPPPLKPGEITYQQHLEAVERGETKMRCRSRSEWEKL